MIGFVLSTSIGHSRFPNKISVVVYSLTGTLAMSEPPKKAGAEAGSNVSKMSERRRLEIQAKLMDQNLQMGTEKRERELEREKIQGKWRAIWKV